jgi:hypothetical protein
MPRKNRRRDDPAGLDEERARRGVEWVHATPDGEWLVRHVSAAASVKTYRCPGCQQEIRPGVAHVVAWPTDGRGDATDRRHWHTACWTRTFRGPRVSRPSPSPEAR